jgi:very-short-patch-repair endonuclease
MHSTHIVGMAQGVVPKGAPTQDLTPVLGHLIWQHNQHVPAIMVISDTSPYFWKLSCNKHVRILTIQGAKRQVDDQRHIGLMSACERCSCAYKLGPAPLPSDIHRSYYEQVAWLNLEHVLASAEVMQYMSAAGNLLHGRDLGYVVEVKVLRGKYGKADIYIPSIDLIIQVDGEHHDTASQQTTDARFNTEAVRQHRRVLRLCYKDVCDFLGVIRSVVHQCIASRDAWAKCTVQHPAKGMLLLTPSI